MGLDMNLCRRHYFDMNQASQIADILDIEDPTGIGHITENVMYWRKANQIHKWFVDNVQGGADDCGEYYVTTEQLRELLDACNAVIENPELGEQVLPTYEGFFFGSADYDEHYIDDVVYTAESLGRLLENEKPCDYYYSTSW